MIIGRIENPGDCPGSPALKEAMDFLRRLRPDTPDGEYEIRGRRILARVMRYPGISRKEGRLESHRRYADIQALLSGTECIEWVALKGDEKAEYDQEADVSFHTVPPAPDGMVRLEPGIFALFMPGDAHMPMLSCQEGTGQVTKVVIKVDVSLIDRGVLD
jgi:YhcH/YjgK/YiaL family protein